MTEAFLAAFDSLPSESFEGIYNGKRYSVLRQDFSSGKSQKLVAQELGGADYISMNLYRLRSGALLKPCEIPEDKVVAFVLGVVPVSSTVLTNGRAQGVHRSIG